MSPLDPAGLDDLSVEPSLLSALTDEQKERLTTILDRYLSELERGVPQDPEHCVREHPDLAAHLQLYLESLTDLQGVSAGFRGSLDAEGPPKHAADDPKRLGDFALGREIGRGGMGVVYEARQISLDRRVALKILPFAAVLDSKQIARFKNEAQAAAQLHHPNIVPVFAIGAERGVHYYAMQFIDGQPLDRAIRELRRQARPASIGEADDADLSSPSSPSSSTSSSSPTSSPSAADVDSSVSPSTCHSFLTEKSTNRRSHLGATLRLAIDAANALDAAHEYGVVHRDIKPSNLLLDENGKIWITDFGLARCQNDATLTRSGDVVGTMRYMSPEQALGKSALVDHRTDIYSLAVTLYEILTLRPAVSGEDGPSLLRSIDQREPTRLRKLRPDISADLETVVMKAMSRDRDDRYATAKEFADDLRRVLEGKPTTAKPPTIPDRVGRWARRHKRVVAVAAGICLCAVLGFAASTVLIAREKLNTQRNFQRAEMQRRRAHEAVDRFGAQLAERLASLPGAEQVRRELLRETLGYYRTFVNEAGDDPALHEDLALTYSKIGTLSDEIGSSDDAIEAHQHAIDLFRVLVEAKPEDAAYQRRLAMSHNNMALSLRRAGRVADASRSYQEALAIQLRLVRPGASAGLLSDLALSYTNLGLLQSETGDVELAEKSFDEAIQLQEKLLAQDAGNPDLLRKLAAAYNNLSAIHLATDLDRAAECYQIAIAHQERAVAASPDELRYQSDWGLTYNNLGAVQSRQEKYAQASESYERAVTIQQRLVAAAPDQKAYRRDLAVSLNNRGLMQTKLSDPRAAERSFRNALELQRDLVLQYPDDLELQSSIGGIYNNLGIVLEEAGQIEDSAVAYKNAVEHQRIAFSRAASVSRYRTFLSKHYYNYSRVLRRLGHPELAARSALARRELWPDDPVQLYGVAEELAIAGAEIQSSEGSDLSPAQCADLAVQTLEEAVAAGLNLPADLPNNRSFALLKGHEGFAKLFGEK